MSCHHSFKSWHFDAPELGMVIGVAQTFTGHGVLLHFDVVEGANGIEVWLGGQCCELVSGSV